MLIDFKSPPRGCSPIHLISILMLSTLALEAAPPLSIPADGPRVEGKLGTFTASWQIENPEPGLTLATLTLSAAEAATPPAIQIKLDFPAVDFAGVWTPDPNKPKLDHMGSKVVSRGVQAMPMVCYFDPGDRNRMTVALSDALRPATISGGIQEEDAKIHLSLDLFGEKQPPLKSYQVTVRLDSRPVTFYQALRDTTRWWAAQENYQPAKSPEIARVPLYSTWYSYHQNLDSEKLVEECRLAGKIGLRGIIVDDGWQTLDGNRGYAYTGDWKPDCIPAMKEFVDRVHALGQEFMLWYSVPMIGEKSEVLKRFEGKTLRHVAGFGAFILDPRYPEVRKFLIETYESAVRDWGLDGLKLDFVSMFAAVPAKDLTASDGRDFASVDEAVDLLMTDIIGSLQKLKPDIAIEFRQPYNGPLMRKYGNMLRAVDCPNSGPVNRMHIVDLRLVADHTAVHSDMILWHPDEPVESAALQVLNIIFSVPQISVRLAEISDDHRAMLAYWMKYWMANRDVLLDGAFEPTGPAQNYPMISGRGNDKSITAIYQDMVVSPGTGAPAAIDVINAKPGTSVVVRFEQAFGNATVRILDTRGSVVKEETLTLGPGVHGWDVPPSGMLEIRRITAK